MIDLYHGNCLDLLPTLPDKSVDMVLCDLPYGTTQCKWDIVIPFEPLWEQYLRVAKEDAAIVLHGAQPFTSALIMSQLKLFKYEWVWEKTHPTGHLNAKKMPMKAHENILVFYCKLPVYNPQKTSGHVRKTAVKRRDATPVYGDQDFIELPYSSTERYPRSVLTFPSDKQRSALHPTQKPLALAEYLVHTYTNPGATVLDNCMGSGTTGVACRKLGRRFIGMELDKAYFEIAKQRIHQE